MPTSFPRSAYCRWVMVYGIATALLVGWLLIEKRADVLKQMAISMENTFRESRQIIARNNRQLLQDIQDFADYYPNPQTDDYRNRAETAWTLEEMFEIKAEAEQLDSLGAYFTRMADKDVFYQMQATKFTDTGTVYFGHYKRLRLTQRLVRSQGLAASILNYCATKTLGMDEPHFWEWWPDFLPSVSAPISGEQFQAEIVLSTFYDPHCAIWHCWLEDQPRYIRDGVARIRTVFHESGPHTLHLRFRREYCRDDSVTDVSRDFQVNVLEPCGSAPTR